jgi:hypothetical protein
MRRQQNLFEIQVYQRDHWVIEGQETDEATAVAFAKSQVSQGKVEGMRVLRQWTRADGAVVETERPPQGHGRFDPRPEERGVEPGRGIEGVEPDPQLAGGVPEPTGHERAVMRRQVDDVAIAR